MSPVSVIALVSAYNEADIIAQVIDDLVRQHISVYLLDDGSTDDTVARVEPFVGRGVIAIERFSTPDANGPPHPFAWEPILRRKSQLAQQLEADWFIHHDADEFRESPWPGVSLRDGIQFVHDAGYNAIDFVCLEFQGDVDSASPSQDVRAAFPCYAVAAPHNRVQIRCWQRTDHAVDLATSGGHDVAFPDRRVFPIRFILRHYPIRGRAHFERKVRHERNYVEHERALGWHIHYSTERAAVPKANALYHPEEVRLDLMLRHVIVEELETTIAALKDNVAALDARLASLGRQLEASQADASNKAAQVDGLGRECQRLQAVVDERGQLIEDIYQSKSWRWSAPARMLARLFGSRR
jgi:glycosyltransferase involved in cell wall biosynthesis